MRQGYRNRNPAGKEYALMVNESYEAMKEGRYPPPCCRISSKCVGFYNHWGIRRWKKHSDGERSCSASTAH